MAENASRQGQQVNQQEGAKGRGLRQQQIEDCCSQGNVQSGYDQLQQCQAQTRQAQGATADLYQQVVGQRLFGCPTAVQTVGQGRAEDQHGRGNRSQQSRRHAQCTGGGGQVT
ncbi:hypothetical protein D3C76_925040 [compost metagenome]